jgi:NAD(P)-dependent dehydrogenase (short-subunit alcohol dehydrogenase family)
MAINAKGIFLGCKYATKQMLAQEPLKNTDGSEKSRGWIVNTASVQGLVPYYGTPSYCASKGAAVMLTKQVALDYAPDRIHCNALCPGFLKTSMTQNLQSQPESLATINASHPFGGMGDPEDVARAAIFLASDGCEMDDRSSATCRWWLPTQVIHAGNIKTGSLFYCLPHHRLSELSNSTRIPVK